MILKDYALFKTIRYLEKTDSTNNFIKREVKALSASVKSGSVVAARIQTAGRGRNERKWFSGKDTSLTFSFLLDLKDKNPNDIAAITLAAGVGTAAALNSLGLNVRLKWPNDVFVGEKKICGILSETVHNGEKMQAVCGIGINVNLDNQALKSIDAPATSIYAETAVKYKPFELLPSVLAGLDRWLCVWYEQGTDPIAEQWMKLAYGLGKGVQAFNGGENCSEGFFVGLGKQGQLKLRKLDGSITELWAGQLIWQ